MFTGIVSDIGEVRHMESRGDLHVAIAAGFDVSALEIGASIACAGICLTIVDKGDGNDRWFEVIASQETQSKTTAGGWRIGQGVNLERPLRVDEDLLRKAFSARRKMLRKALPGVDFAALGIDATLRPENLSPEDYARLSMNSIL